MGHACSAHILQKKLTAAESARARYRALLGEIATEVAGRLEGRDCHYPSRIRDRVKAITDRLDEPTVLTDREVPACKGCAARDEVLDGGTPLTLRDGKQLLRHLSRRPARAEDEPSMALPPNKSCVVKGSIKRAEGGGEDASTS